VRHPLSFLVEQLQLVKTVFGNLEGPGEIARAVDQNGCGRLLAVAQAFAAEGIAGEVSGGLSQDAILAGEGGRPIIAASAGKSKGTPHP
jgi:hypothetical protein